MNGKDLHPLDPRQDEGLDGCSSLLHLRTCRQKMFMVMACHGQQAGIDLSVPGCAVAGLLASQYAWEGFGATCSDLLSPAVEFGDFLKTLESAGIVGICAAAGPSTSDSARAAFGNSSPVPEHIDPRLICFEHCVVEAARRLAPAAAGETVCFIMDWLDPLAPSALWHLENLTNFSSPAVRVRLGTLGFEHSETFLPLQTATLLARRCAEVTPSTGLRVASHGFHALNWTFLDRPSSPCLGEPLRMVSASIKAGFHS